ncbi:ABC transporter ATP-binding protein [Candidatus Dojkabacteria bacterium]|nr:ABC transporter ATP-binding protein [Candidatus Dojkabacteria bacterium]
MAKDILRAKNVYKIYEEGRETEVRALDGLSLTVFEGEIVAVMGPSGSGKTTLLNCFSGIDSATRGEIVIDGQDIQKLSDRKKTLYRAKKMGFIFQSFNLIPVLTALENVELPLLVNGVPKAEARERAITILNRVGLSDRLAHTPNELSGGQKQRVTVARALAHKPSIVWADEPTGNLDSHTADSVMELISELQKENNATFVLVTHDEKIAKKADRIVRLMDGKIK